VGEPNTQTAGVARSQVQLKQDAGRVCRIALWSRFQCVFVFASTQLDLDQDVASSLRHEQEVAPPGMTICVRTRSCSNPHWPGELPALAPMMRFRSALSFLAVVAGLPCSSSASAAPAARPNVLLILADDLGWSDIACYGAPDIRTPELDRLASQGVRFTQFYANGTECTPSRTALLTGRYQQRVGGLECAIGIGGVGRYDDAMRLAEAGELGLPASETTIAEMVRDAGYATAMSGKWHLGYADKFSPNRHGFQHALYAEGGGMDYFHHVEDPPSLTHVLRLDEKPLMRPGEYFTELAASDAIDWITTH